jgi:hypothetical protein
MRPSPVGRSSLATRVFGYMITPVAVNLVYAFAHHCIFLERVKSRLIALCSFDAKGIIHKIIDDNLVILVVPELVDNYTVL